MAKQNVNINSNSIASSVTSDYKKAICEYIWNGFDANAINVNVDYAVDALGTITKLVISDDGEGIKFSTLSSTFGWFQDSLKRKSFQWSSQIKGKKGKGRFSFDCFANVAEWDTVCEEEGNLLRHKIKISKGDYHHYDEGDKDEAQIVHGVETGTTVTFLNTSLSENHLSDNKFWEYLRKEFAVFLLLNRNKDKSIRIKGKSLDINEVIDEIEEHPISLHDKNDEAAKFDFNITFVRWKEKMKENYCEYFLDSDQYEKYEKTTSFNRKDTEFHHSLYVVSSYFNRFEYIENDAEIKDLFSVRNQNDYVFKELCKKLKSLLLSKEKEFIYKVGGNQLIEKYVTSGVIRKARNKYDEGLLDDLKSTIKGLYSVQPSIFTNLGKTQASTLVGFIELLLQSDKREEILSIMESIVNLNDDERTALKEVLKQTEMSSIIRTIEMLNNRNKTIAALIEAVNNPTLSINEKDDLQKMVGNAFWIFGEEYNLVTEAEPDFQQALTAYLDKLHEDVVGKSKSRINADKIEHPDVNKEMDFFAFRQNVQTQTIDNIVVEIKGPNVRLGEIEVSQIKTYMRLIAEQAQFNATNVNWKFYLVGKDYDKSGYIQGELNSNINWGKNRLIHKSQTQNGIAYEIYVVKWGELFADFDIRFKFIKDKLNSKREKLTGITDKQELHRIIEESN